MYVYFYVLLKVWLKKATGEESHFLGSNWKDLHKNLSVEPTLQSFTDVRIAMLSRGTEGLFG